MTQALQTQLQTLQAHDSSTNACITLPIRFPRSGDRRDRRLTRSMTVLTVLTVRVFC